jgi:hypothetical protein
LIYEPDSFCKKPGHPSPAFSENYLKTGSIVRNFIPGKKVLKIYRVMKKLILMAVGIAGLYYAAKKAGINSMADLRKLVMPKLKELIA